MTNRERLVELYERAKEEYAKLPIVNGSKVDFNYFLADHLIENGVIVPVRCGECSRCELIDLSMFPGEEVPVSYCTKHKICMEGNDYCSKGQRKENGDE